MKKYKYSEITPEQIYNKRRKFIKSIGLSVGSLSLMAQSETLMKIKKLLESLMTVMTN